MSFNKSVSNPVHTHDCDCCSFLGNFIYKESAFDLYHCPRENELIARYGADGNYMSTEVNLARIYEDAHPLEQAHGLHKLNLRLEEEAAIELAAERTEA